MKALYRRDRDHDHSSGKHRKLSKNRRTNRKNTRDDRIAASE